MTTSLAGWWACFLLAKGRVAAKCGQHIMGELFTKQEELSSNLSFATSSAFLNRSYFHNSRLINAKMQVFFQ
jgi:hypothetical protein